MLCNQMADTLEIAKEAEKYIIEQYENALKLLNKTLFVTQPVTPQVNKTEVPIATASQQSPNTPQQLNQIEIPIATTSHQTPIPQQVKPILINFNDKNFIVTKNLKCTENKQCFTINGTIYTVKIENNNYIVNGNKYTISEYTNTTTQCIDCYSINGKNYSITKIT